MMVVFVLAAGCAGFLIAWSLAEERQANIQRMRLRSLLVAKPEGASSSGTARKGLKTVLFSKLREQEYRLEIERHVPEMVDAIALGMRSGLSFESAFRMYCTRFDDALAKECMTTLRTWESGLVDRDEALRELGRKCGSPSLARFGDNVVRCLRFGSPMGHMLEVLASESRSSYRAAMEEKVAKAPVKMLAPTAGLILPAMLILIMAPVILEFI